MKLAQNEGIFTTISGGATFAIAMKIAERSEKRYLSSALFETIQEYITEEEVSLLESTPGFHMPDS
jgi:cysteine synthase A